ncbi:MAG TPA: tail fiber domain-containing protein, partial [Chitinophagales bacterium]|nr:tail fiber domain-containing protein [Chitinophagales bacterium]
VNAGIGAFAGDFPLGEEEDTTNALNFGVYATSGKTTNENRAGFFQINTDEAQASVNIAVLGQVTGDSAHASNYWAGFFDGKVEITGDLVTPSDRMLKKNIEDIDNALEKLMQLQPRQYEYKTDEYENITLGKGRHYGLLADELKDVFPELVHEVTHPAQWKRTGKWLSGTVVHPQMSYSGINYLKLIPVFIQAMKEQQAIIDSLQASVQSMDDRLKALEAKEGVQYRMSDPGSEETVHEMTVELSTLQVVVLDQNVPNPFAESTSISYFIPEEAGAAKIMFFDLTGRILKTVDVQKGYGIITVFAPNLSSGTYSYSLVIDGRVAETRRMEKMR